MRISDTGIIELCGMEFHAFHGCLDSEKASGNLFKVDFWGKTDISKAAQSDNLDDTVDCRLIYDLIKQEMSVESNLLENVAARIVHAIMEATGDAFESIKVTVSKHNPPLDGICEWSKVTAGWNI